MTELAVSITAMIIGHPWDLWGLAQAFQSKNSSIRIEAAKPEGAPTFNPNDKAANDKFERRGYDAQATLRATHRAASSRINDDDIADAVADLITRINRSAKLLDPGFLGVRIFSVAYDSEAGSGVVFFASRTPNKGASRLAEIVTQTPVMAGLIDLAGRDAAVAFVIAAFDLPVSWASLYLVYDRIASTVGGIKNLTKAGLGTAAELSDFSYSANASRDLVEGIRHGNEGDPPKPLISLAQGRDIIARLTLMWLQKRLAGELERAEKP